MKSLMTAALAGLLLFSISAGVSYYLYLNREPPAEEVAENEDDNFPVEVPADRKVEMMPVAMRPNTPPTIEAVLELAQSISKKEQMVLDNEKRLAREERRIALLFEDVKRERDELTAFGQKIEAKLLAAKEAVELLKLENKKIDDQIQTLTSLEKKTGKTTDDVADDAEAEKLKTAKNWFKSLEANQAANMIKEFANKGDLAFAAQIMKSLDARKVGEIITAIDDPPLITQLFEAIESKKVAEAK